MEPLWEFHRVQNGYRLPLGDSAGFIGPMDHGLRTFAPQIYRGVIDEGLAARVGLSSAQVEDMYKIMAIANYEDRFVIPTSHREMGGLEDAYDLRGSCGFSFGNGCSGGTSEANLFGAPKQAKAKTPMEVA